MSIEALLRDWNPWWADSGARTASRRPVRRSTFDRLWCALRDATSRRALLLLGPRQVGKTVLLRQLADALLDAGAIPSNVAYFDMSDDRLREPVALRAVVEACRGGATPEHPRFLLLDEVQAAEEGWDRYLRLAVDGAGELQDGRPAERMVLTGSAASALRTAGRESGLGRWDEIPIEGLSFLEYLRIQGLTAPKRLSDVSSSDVDRYLARGGFPEQLRWDSNRDAWKHLRADIADRAILRDLLRSGVDVQQVRSLFTELMGHSGDILDRQNLCDDLKCDRRSLDRYLELLEDTRLVSMLPEHIESTKRRSRLRQQSKLYASDHGLIMAFSQPIGPAPASQMRGKVFEAVVYRHLREVALAHQAELSYLRVEDNVEADFVVETPGARTVIEVTCSTKDRSTKPSRLRTAAKQLTTDHRYLITDGITEQRVDDIMVLPLASFLIAPERVLEGR